MWLVLVKAPDLSGAFLLLRLIGFPIQEIRSFLSHYYVALRPEIIRSKTTTNAITNSA